MDSSGRWTGWSADLEMIYYLCRLKIFRPGPREFKRMVNRHALAEDGPRSVHPRPEADRLPQAALSRRSASPVRYSSIRSGLRVRPTGVSW